MHYNSNNNDKKQFTQNISTNRPAVIFYGADWCGDCRRVNKLLVEHNVEYQFIDVDLNTEASEYVKSVNGGKRRIPTLLINDVPYGNPNNIFLANLLGIEISHSKQNPTQVEKIKCNCAG